VNVVVAHTADLAPVTLTAVRALLDTAFGNEHGNEHGGDFDGDDWDHALGGMHAMAWEGDELVRRRRGIGAAVMAPVERIIRGAYDLGALGSSEMGIPFYEARGWRRWHGQTWAMTPTGITRTPDDDDGVYVLAVGPVDLTADLTCDWRAGDLW
jgi:aminoglycoside 2'-N-acetyltransferase I